MIWTLIAFGLSLLVLRKFAFPRIAEALEKRAAAIAESIDAAERTSARPTSCSRSTARALRRRASRPMTSSPVRARPPTRSRTSEGAAVKQREELMAATRRDIEPETRRALDEIRKEVADLTVLATEKVTRKALDDRGRPQA